MSKIPYRGRNPEQSRRDAVAFARLSERSAREIAREVGVSYESPRLGHAVEGGRRRREVGRTTEERAELRELCSGCVCSSKSGRS